MVFNKLIEGRIENKLAKILEKKGAYCVVVEPDIKEFSCYRRPDIAVYDNTGRLIAIIEIKGVVSTHTLVWLKDLASIYNYNIKIIIIAIKKITKDALMIAKNLKNFYLIKDNNLDRISQKIIQLITSEDYCNR
jgi:hypothetical protein